MKPLNLCLLALLLATLWACRTPQQVQQMQPADILSRAVAAAGGDTWQRPQSLRLQGTADFFPYGKVAERMHFDQYAMFRIYPPSNDEAHKANGKVRFDAAWGDSTFFKLIFNGKESSTFLSGRAKPYEKHFSWSNNFGFGIIRFANAPGFKLERLADDDVEGHPCYFLQITDPKQGSTVFGIDKARFFIRFLGFNTEVGYHHRVYSQFKRAPNVAFVQPTRVRLYFEGVKWMDIQWKQFAVNQPIADAVFGL